MASGLDAMLTDDSREEPAFPSTRMSTMSRLTLKTIVRHSPLDAPKLIHQLRGDLDWIVMKALEKDRARRYETAKRPGAGHPAPLERRTSGRASPE